MFSGLILALILLPVLLFTFTPSVAEAFFNGFADFKPKSKTVLPADIQKAIATEAIKELTQGVDYGGYPNSKSYQVGLNVTF